MSTMGAIGRQLLGIVLGGACVFSTSCATAQITPDRTLPNNSNVTINGSVFNITGGTQAGRNLFHSFQQFSVPTGGTAAFNNGLDVQNIFSRVTGGSGSNIDGIIQTNGTANLFFLNPNGIVFGKNASLNVGGSFVATTANAIQFGKQEMFSASQPNNPALLTVNPTALFYNQIVKNASIQNSSIAPAAVAPTAGNSSGLQIPDGKSLLLVGGDLTMDGGRLTAHGGHVELGGLTSKGTVGLEVYGNNLTLSFPNQTTLASVSLLKGASVDTLGSGGGSIAVNASNLNINSGSSLIAGIAPAHGNVGSKAGDIMLNITGDINIDGNGSNITNNVQQQAIGNGGNITLSSNSLVLSNGGQISASTLGTGDAGNVFITVRDRVVLNGRSTDGKLGSNILSAVDQDAMGRVGNTQISANTVEITDGAQAGTVTFGFGDAGNVTIKANRVFLSGRSRDGNFASSIATRVEKNAMGKGGNLEIFTNSLELSNGAQLLSTTSGVGDAGSISISARERVFVNNSDVFSRVDPTGLGNSGNLQITTDNLEVANLSQLSASTLGVGNAGNVIITANRASIIDSDILSRVARTAMGKGGNVQITTNVLEVINGGSLTVNTLGIGDAGNVIINARDHVLFSGISADGNFSSGAFSDVLLPNAHGNGGNIQISTKTLEVTNGGELFAGTAGVGNAGNIVISADNVLFGGIGPSGIISGAFSIVNRTGNGKGGNLQISTNTLNITNGAELLASTFGTGNAGNVSVRASGSVSLDGTNSGVLSTVESGAIGKGGNVSIQARTLSVNNNARVSVAANTSGQESAANILIQTSQLTLDHEALLSATTTSGNGGNITLQPQDLLLLRHGSQISTTAGTASAGGNSGNITINTPNGFIVSIPNENSDITANAFSGQGGKVTINATNVFNIAPLSRQDLARLRPQDLNPRQLPTNDITAVSQQNADLNGIVQINTPEVDPSRGLVTLPTVTEVAPKLVATSCAAFDTGGSSFTVTGRSGLPPRPDEPLTSDVVWTDTRLPVTTEQHQHKTHAAKPKPQPIAIIPATGWVLNDKGEVTLISSVSNATTLNTPTSCPVR